MSRRSIFSVLGVAAVGAVLASACGGQGPSTSAGVLRVATYVGETTMDPYDGARAWPEINMVFDRLIGVDKNFTPIPELATEWSSNDDLTVWTLILREGVNFHDGSAFDADDAVYSIGRMIDPVFDSALLAVLGIISTAEAVDPHTLKLTLSGPEADLPLLLADYRALMTPVDSADTVGTAPIGTGPFKLEKFDPAGVSRFVANADYFLGAPKLAAIEVAAIEDNTAATQALAGGQVDLLLGIDAKSSAQFSDASKFTLQQIPSGDWNAIDFRVDQKPFDDPRVRKALRIAVDRQALTDLVLGEGAGVPTCDTPVWSGDPFRWDGDCAQDIEGAKALLAEAGYPDGIDIEIFTSDVEDNMVELVQVYQEQVKAAGIRVTLTTTDASGYWDDVWMMEPAFVDSWGQRPAVQVLNEVYRSTASWNPTGQADPVLDAMLDEARSIANATMRAEKYRAIQEYLFETTAIFVPYHKTIVRAMSAAVKGIDPIVIDAVRWEKITVG